MVCDFVVGRSRIFLLEGGWRVSRTHIPNQTWLLPTDAVQRWGYAKRHPQSTLQHFSNSIINNKQQASHRADIQTTRHKTHPPIHFGPARFLHGVQQGVVAAIVVPKLVTRACIQNAQPWACLSVVRIANKTLLTLAHWCSPASWRLYTRRPTLYSAWCTWPGSRSS